jgi:hypothetical protein
MLSPAVAAQAAIAMTSATFSFPWLASTEMRGQGREHASTDSGGG